MAFSLCFSPIKLVTLGRVHEDLDALLVAYDGLRPATGLVQLNRPGQEAAGGVHVAIVRTHFV